MENFFSGFGLSPCSTLASLLFFILSRSFSIYSIFLLILFAESNKKSKSFNYFYLFWFALYHNRRNPSRKNSQIYLENLTLNEIKTLSICKKKNEKKCKKNWLYWTYHLRKLSSIKTLVPYPIGTLVASMLTHYRRIHRMHQLFSMNQFANRNPHAEMKTEQKKIILTIENRIDGIRSQNHDFF